MADSERVADTCGDSESEADSLRDRAVRLFRYLNALAELRARTVRDVTAYEAIFWFSDLPCEKECYTPAWNPEEHTDEENWLRIEKPVRPVRPEPPAECEHWYSTGTLDDISAEPKLHEEIIDPNWVAPPEDGERDEPESLSPPPIRLDDQPNVAAAWGRYLETQWRPWQAEYQRWEEVQRAYRKLFAIYQQQQRRGEQYELLLGVGVLVWITSNGQKVRRPVLTARVTLELERESGCITLTPAVDGASFAVEQEMLEVDDRPPIQDQREIEEQVSGLESLWHRGVVTPLLKWWLNTLPSAADAEYHDSLQCPDRATKAPQMAFAPVLILRRRGAQTMRDFLKKVVESLSDGKPIPRGVAGLCGAVHSWDGRRDGPAVSDQLPEEVLFPLPTNDEQLAIIRRLHGRTGVLVQGPPGTGKSHTIVNLISHLLACGLRVLVTSQTPRALKVLQDKMPEAIRPLAVSLLGEDAQSRQNLEYCVQGILRHVDQTNPDVAQREIETTTLARQKLRTRLADLHRRLRETREAETTVYSVPGTPYEGTAQAIAQAVMRDTKRFSWFGDDIGEHVEAPLNNDEFQELRTLWDKCCFQILSYALPKVDALPTADELAKANEACSRARKALTEAADSTDVSIAEDLGSLGRERLGELSKLAQQLLRVCDWLGARTEPWIGQVREDALTGHAHTWSSLECTTGKALESLAAFMDNKDGAELESSVRVSTSQLLADATDLLAHLEAGRTLGFWIFRDPVVKRCTYLWRDTRFGGRLCSSQSTLASLLPHLRARLALDRAWKEWDAIVQPPSGTLRHRVAWLNQSWEVLKVILQFGRLVTAIQKVLGGRRLEGHGSPAPGLEWARQVLINARAATALLDVRDAEAVLVGTKDRITQLRRLANPHPLAADLIDAAMKGDVRQYQAELVKLAELHRGRALAQRCLSLDKRLRTLAPRLADTLKDPVARSELDAHMESFTTAWAWRRAQAWLERFAAEHRAEFADEIRQVEHQLRKTTEVLVALKAWQSCIATLASNPAHQGALTAWQQMIRKIGKGKGKYAETYRRDARKYMQQCRHAIPAWIMPLYRVAEQVEAEPEVFDVVIIDEASQTGPEGLILQYLAKQCVIVGDHKQISPEGGFIDRSQVATLIEQHLSGIPFYETLDPATSLFDQAAIRYGNRITLREHFRCMPEIIRFSNDLCYPHAPLIPLRQYPPSRLPPIQVRFVTDGYREGTSQQAINRPEAAALAKTVIDCLNDPRYKGKSFGVICLQGHAQSQLIENMILDKVGPEPFKDTTTRLLCGDPYSFQGDERDVVFLSMVASVEGDARSAPLTREAFQQRFNVAASRPRDQVWLFHSIRESDLHPECMRRRLLNYYYNPEANQPDHVGRSYESDFERDVGEALIRVGFRVTPQYEVAGKRIDLVVEDRERRIAIECDGDRWHGPDQYDADMARQRMLERCGWTFLRVRGSVFYANQSKAFEDLIAAIRAHGIQAHSFTGDDAIPRDWVEEVSGAECMQSLGTHTAEVADENIVQGELFPEDEQRGASTTTPPAPRKPRTRGVQLPGLSGSVSSGQEPSSAPTAPVESTRNSEGRESQTDGSNSMATPSPGRTGSGDQGLFVTPGERASVVRALEQAGRSLVMWQLAQRAEIPERRMEQILDVLVHEACVKLDRDPDANRYGLPKR